MKGKEIMDRGNVAGRQKPIFVRPARLGKLFLLDFNRPGTITPRFKSDLRFVNGPVPIEARYKRETVEYSGYSRPVDTGTFERLPGRINIGTFCPRFAPLSKQSSRKYLFRTENAYLVLHSSASSVSFPL